MPMASCGLEFVHSLITMSPSLVLRVSHARVDPLPDEERIDDEDP